MAKSNEYDCPHCGQDLRLPPDAYEQFAQFKALLELLNKWKEFPATYSLTLKQVIEKLAG